jgi:hypothetical protein
VEEADVAIEGRVALDEKVSGNQQQQANSPSNSSCRSSQTSSATSAS